MKNYHNQLRFARNPYYEQYERLLVKLHEAIALENEDEAERIREAMDAPEAELSGEEIARLNGLSADLYTLSGCSPGGPTVQRDTDPVRFAAMASALGHAWGARDAELTLRLLRQASDILSPAKAAYIRSRAYWILRHCSISDMFLARAVELDPAEENYKFLQVTQLLSQGRDRDAQVRITEHVRQPGMSADTRIQLLCALYVSTRGTDDSSANSVLEEVVRLLTTLLNDERSAIEPVMAVQGYIALGSALERLGRAQDAMDAYDFAITRDPVNDEARTLRGLLLEKTDPLRSRSDFEAAVQLGTRLPIPYLVLSRMQLESKEPAGALNTLRRLQHLPLNPSLLAVTWEFIAIAQAKLGEDRARVLGSFGRALEFDPLNERIQSNMEAYSNESTADDFNVSGPLTDQLASDPIGIDRYVATAA